MTARLYEPLIALFESHFGTAPTLVQPLEISGSDRHYFRLTAAGTNAAGSTQTAIGTLSDNTAENNTFFYFTQLLHKHQVRVPEIYGVSRDRKAYLQEDLGGESLFGMLQREGLSEPVRAHYHKALEGLARIQWLAGREADFKQCFATSTFDEGAILADLHYFKYYFADLQKVSYDRLAVAEEMAQIARELGRYQPQMLMYRDFQSRNIMVLPGGEVGFIDYQGAMQGPPQYDLASLLWQAKAGLPQDWRDDLINGYIKAVQDLQIRFDEVHFRRGYSQFVLLRLLQVLGAYGFRGLLERKPHFLSSIAPALRNLRTFLDNNPQAVPFPALRSLLERLTQEDILARYAYEANPAEVPKLKVAIHSFSYKVGVPADESDNGGGFVFDCRGILNPGRQAEYKHLSGRDPGVKHYLETQTQMPQFMQNVFALVSISVEDYLMRGFENLMVNFGCTGGQHRSVYAAEALAAYLKARYGLEAVAVHRNEERWPAAPVTED